VLYLVDRNNLADQTLAESQNYRGPDDGRRFTGIYNVDKLTGGHAWLVQRGDLNDPAGSQGTSGR